MSTHTHAGVECTDKRCVMPGDLPGHPWLICRYHYSVQEIWGPYATVQEAREVLESVMKAHRGKASYDPKYFSLVQIHHPTKGARV